MEKKRVIAVLTFALILLVVGVATALAASPARLDPGFGTGGFVRTALPPTAAVGMAAEGDRVARDSSGRLVVVGGVGDRLLAARYLADGTLDPGFGEAGLAEVALQGSVQATAVAIEPGGGILVGGSFGTRQPRAVLVKLTADGALDPSFQGPNSPQGTANVGTGEGVAALALQGRKILVGGENGYLARLDPDGSRDTSFAAGHGYKVVLPPTPPGAKRFDRVGGVTSILAPKGGKILAAGYFNGSFFLARLTAAGRLDRSFAGGGVVRTNAAARAGCGCSVGQGLARDGNGRLYVSGFVLASRQPAYRPDVAVKSVAVAVARYLPDGRLDRSFGAHGVARTPGRGGEPFGRGIAIGPGGRPVVAGALVDSPNGPSRLAAFRYLPDGKPDPSFFDHGTFIGPVHTSQERAAAWDPLIDASGRLVLAGAAISPAPGSPDQLIPEFVLARIR